MPYKKHDTPQTMLMKSAFLGFFVLSFASFCVPSLCRAQVNVDSVGGSLGKISQTDLDSLSPVQSADMAGVKKKTPGKKKNTEVDGGVSGIFLGSVKNPSSQTSSAEVLPQGLSQTPKEQTPKNTAPADAPKILGAISAADMIGQSKALGGSEEKKDDSNKTAQKKTIQADAKWATDSLPPKIESAAKESSDFIDALLGERPGALDLSKAISVSPDYMQPLPLDAAVSLTLKNNPEVEAARAKVDTVKWENWGSYAQYGPSIEGTYARGAEKSTPGSYNDSSGSRVATTMHHRIDRSLFIRQPLIDLAVVSDIMRTSDNVDVSDAELRDTQEQAAYNTVRSYLKLLQARKLIEISDAYKKILTDLSDRMRIRYDGGAATNVDINRIKSRMNVAEAARLQSLGEYGMAMSEFRRLSKIVPAQLIMPDKLAPSVPLSLQDAMEKALKDNPTYIASLRRISVAESDRYKTLGAIMPKMSAEMSNVYTYGAGGAAHGNPIDGVYPTQEDTRFMLVAKWELSPGTQLASTMVGSSKIREMQSKSVDVRARLEEALSTAYDSLNASRRRISILKESYDSNKKIVAEVEEQFLRGQRSLFELLDAHDRNYSAKTELARELFVEAMASYQIRLQTGEIAKAVLEEKGK